MSTRSRNSVISRRGTAAVTVSTAIAAASGYLILFIAARALGPAGYAQFSVFWSLYFGVLGVLFGLQQESTRSASSAALANQADGTDRVRLIRATLGIGMVFGLLIAISGAGWSRAVFASQPLLLTAIVAAASPLYAGQTGVLGALSGTRRWNAVSAIVTAEAVVRLVAVAVAAWAGWGVGGMAVATGLAATAWIVVCVVSSSARVGLHLVGDSTSREFRSRSNHTMVAAAASAALVVGFPVLLELTTPSGLGEAGGRLVLAITLTRAPLLMPLNAFQGVAINHFVTRRAAGFRALVPPSLLICAVGCVGALAAWLVGAPLLSRVFGSGFEVTPAVLVYLTLGATLIAALTLTGTAVIARDEHRAFVAGWVVASVVTLAVLLVPAALTPRAIAGLLIGPASGIVVHLVALARSKA